MVRFKNRYALCELVFPEPRIESRPVDTHQVYQAVRASLLDSHGDFGLAALQSSLSVKYLNIKTNMAVIRGERCHFDMLTSSLVFIRKVGGRNVVFKTLHVGGSIRSCQKFLINHHRKNMAQIFPNCKTAEERAEVMKSIMAACESLELGHKQTAAASQPAAPAAVYSALSMLQEEEEDAEAD